MMKRLRGWDDVVGRKVLITEHSMDNNSPFTIIGVFKDIHIGTAESNGFDRPVVIFYGSQSHGRNNMMLIQFDELTVDGMAAERKGTRCTYWSRCIRLVQILKPVPDGGRYGGDRIVGAEGLAHSLGRFLAAGNGPSHVLERIAPVIARLIVPRLVWNVVKLPGKEADSRALQMQWGLVRWADTKKKNITKNIFEPKASLTKNSKLVLPGAKSR